MLKSLYTTNNKAAPPNSKFWLRPCQQLIMIMNGKFLNPTSIVNLSMWNENDTPIEIAYESLVIEERVLSIVHEGRYYY